MRDKNIWKSFLRHIVPVFFASVIGLYAYFTMALRAGVRPSNTAIIMLGVNVALIFAFTLIVSIKLPLSIRGILGPVVLLNFLGITMITRIDYERAKNNIVQEIGLRQQIWLCVALVIAAIIVLVLRDYRYLRRISWISMIISIILLILPVIPFIGQNINGARVWVRLGPFSFQPGEFAKLFLAIFFAAYLFDHRDQLSVAGKKFLGVYWPRFRDLAPIIIVWVVSMGILVLQHDLGTSLMFFAMFIGMLYIATKRISWIILGVISFFAGAVVAAKIFATFATRVTIWLHPFDPALYKRSIGGSYQIVQGLFGMGSGGIFGTGLGHGYPAITPFANSDFIYASLGEELGLIGCIAILVFYLIIISSGFITALESTDGFGKLMCAGLAFSMAFQIFTVVGGITLVIPLTGLTLPFVAAGGSSLVANWILVTLILIVSNAANAPQSTIVDTTTLEKVVQLARDKKWEAVS